MKLTNQIFLLALSGALFLAPYATAIDEAAGEEQFEIGAAQDFHEQDFRHEEAAGEEDFQIPSEEDFQRAAEDLSKMSPEQLREINEAAEVFTAMLQQPETPADAENS